MRLGFLRKAPALNNPIWIHAVSVGEAMAVKGLLEEIKNAYPGRKLIISTITETGNKIAASIAKEGDFVTYLPLDFSFIVKSVIDRMKPAFFIIAETELWPNLILYLYKKKIPVVLVNGRISDKSFRGYSCVRFLLRPVLEKVSLFCVQTDRDAQRFMRLGVSRDKIHVTGNMKFDAVTYAQYNPDLKPGPKERFLVAGSTHPGEEGIILEAYRQLCKEFSQLRLIIAPRHPERAAEVENIVVESGFKPVRISTLKNPAERPESAAPVFILDTVGELMSYYAIADIVFIGGSLIKKGGHNILEPASLSKAILFGPHMFNFRDITELFLDKKAAISVRNQEELTKNIGYLLNDPGKIIQLGQLAYELVLKNQGATKRNLGLIRRLS